ncbi:ABC transporter substrate-binding protein [Alkalimonas collagenimarina]|uniref:ABC transporter substrate-binding protein n=1 Tax=Alkalimonas collagenimarina TaxID=400390 RepID=A0ABT9GVW7_9GAMM|nr:ABC transporter substrate-binding protein [Alkalimonas collagenimarina]MDP4535190.1 ABC transporter substrate-binding protein [Alkalimonas collagenimarina]
MKLVKLFTQMTATFALLLSVSLSAAEVQKFTDPYEMISVVADQAFTRLAAEKDNIMADPELMRAMVNEELLPYIDVRYAAFRVIGNHIRNTTEEERDAFVIAFQEYMIATYAGTLTLYRDQQVIIAPSQDVGNRQIATVRARVIDPGKPDIVIEFKLRRARDSEYWQVFDMVAEGISLLDSKRAELAGMIRQQGLSRVTELLQERAKAPIEPAEPAEGD